MCIDFRDLNGGCLKDNYPLPNMENLLQRITGSQMMSFLDDFFGYNQVIVKEEDHLKTAFTTPWGMHIYLRMPFGLLNAGSIFQRAMDFTFKDPIGKVMEIYQDDFTVASKERKDHCKHLRKVFEKCRQYNISLNPKKSIFGLNKGRLLGHVVSKDGISIDPERIQAISNIPYPKNQDALRSFFGKINFVRRFIPNFAEIIKPMSNLLKKNTPYIWDSTMDEAFEEIKKRIASAPILCLQRHYCWDTYTKRW